MSLPKIVLLLCLLPLSVRAQTFHMKDGKAIAAKEIRRDGAFFFLKVAGPDGAFSETVAQLPQVERVDFGEPPALGEARQLVRQGDAPGVLEKTAPLAVFFRTYSDVPGNLWAEVMRLRLPALAVAGTPEAMTELQSLWTPTGDGELDTACRLLLAARTDPAGARTAWSALAQPGASSLATGISWLALGEEALQAKKWKEAIHAFLCVEVFLPQQRLLQPKALLGALKAFEQKGERTKAAALVEELKVEYPAAPETAAASALLR